ncbi:hypothetical protein BX666DRAFT_1959151 [Dichotomocladium elegans]|nr:hypothetical protein BX666DRAFT_1959151 [Dichotomocladium elegans]
MVRQSRTRSALALSALPRILFGSKHSHGAYAALGSSRSRAGQCQPGTWMCVCVCIRGLVSLMFVRSAKIVGRGECRDKAASW